MLSRRAFVTSVLALPVWMALPRLLGDPAGGYFAPVPEDLGPYLRWSEWIKPIGGTAWMKSVTVSAAWAPLGCDRGTVQMFAGTIIGHRDEPLVLTQQRQVNAERSLRETLIAHHDPGWFKVPYTKTGVDEDGETTVYRVGSRWQRIGYLHWMTASDLHWVEVRVA